MNRTEGRTALLAALASGIALALAFPSADRGWLAFIALTPLLRALPSAPPAAAFRLGWLAGGAFHAILLYWILGVMTRYGGLSLPLGVMVLTLLVAYLASYVGLFAALVSASTRRWGPAAVLLAPVFWVGLELVRSRILTGFPWGLVGYSQWRNVDRAGERLGRQSTRSPSWSFSPTPRSRFCSIDRCGAGRRAWRRPRSGRGGGSRRRRSAGAALREREDGLRSPSPRSRRTSRRIASGARKKRRGSSTDCCR
jgi:hypothetical protein